MEEIRKQVYDSVEKWSKQGVGVSRMREFLLKNLDQDVTIDEIREIKRQLGIAKQGIKKTKKLIEDAALTPEDTKKIEKEDGGLKEFVKSGKEEPKYYYNPDTDEYTFIRDKIPHTIKRTTILAMCEAYSPEGKNLSQKQMLLEFHLNPDIWNTIKPAIEAYKTGLPDDPETIKMLSEGDMEEYVAKKSYRLKESQMRRMYDNEEKRIKDNLIKKYARSNKLFDLFVEKLDHVVDKIKPVDFSQFEIKEIDNDDTRDVFITDAHIGKLGTQGIIERFKKLTRDLIQTSEKNINLTFGGDLAECFVPYGEMHPGQRLGMENIETTDLIMLVVEVFQTMLIDLYKAGKVVTFNGMGGNHDRFTEQKEFDPFRTPAITIYKFLQKLLENTTVKINIMKEKANTLKSGKVKYIFLHGDGVSDTEIKRRALDDIEDGYYMIYVTGDKHHYKQIELSRKVLWIQSPALAGSGKYDKSLGMSSLPGCVEFKENSDGLVDITTRRYSE